MNTRQAVALSGVLIAGSLLTACGEDGAERTQAEFVADANQLCDELIETRTALADKHFPSATTMPTVEQLQGFYAVMAPVFAAFVEEFADIEPADADRDVYDQLVGVGRQTAATMETAATDTATAQRLLDTDEAEFHESEPLIAELGLNPAC